MKEPIGWITGVGPLRFDWGVRFRRYYNLGDGPLVGIRPGRFEATLKLTKAGVECFEDRIAAALQAGRDPSLESMSSG